MEYTDLKIKSVNTLKNKPWRFKMFLTNKDLKYETYQRQNCENHVDQRYRQFDIVKDFHVFW